MMPTKYFMINKKEKCMTSADMTTQLEEAVVDKDSNLQVSLLDFLVVKEVVAT